ncbi:MAG TPA: TetR/AcrR family transcriptional regulator [Candidatus Acidoferrum sp.]|jgi:AcrR family transcriptional regulator
MLERGNRREELLEQVVDVLLEEGISELSLRPLAKAIGTSARLLIYHFGSKEVLLTQALEQVRERVQDALRDLAVRKNPRSLEEFLLLFWRWALKPANQRYFRLLYEMDGLALYERSKFPANFWSTGVKTWLRILETEFGQLSVRNGGNSAASTYVLATINGLLHDFLATGDGKRTTNALQILIASLRAGRTA